jgi:hypothetical protein
MTSLFQDRMASTAAPPGPGDPVERRIRELVATAPRSALSSDGS